MLIGYIRVSTASQRYDRQLDQLVEYGVDERNIYEEKISGTKSDRPELNRMLDGLKEGDC
jgi:DNA invertase Pin-like site-specific DNA recombinase